MDPLDYQHYAECEENRYCDQCDLMTVHEYDCTYDQFECEDCGNAFDESEDKAFIKDFLNKMTERYNEENKNV